MSGPINENYSTVAFNLRLCLDVDMVLAPEQWKIVLVGGLGGLLGSIIDSLLGNNKSGFGSDN